MIGSELLNQISFKYILFRGNRYDQRTVLEGIDHLANYLNKNNSSSSPFVLLSMYNHIKSVIAYFAILKSGKIAVIYDPGSKPIDLSEIIEDTDPSAIIFINAETTGFNFEEEIIFRKTKKGNIVHSNLTDVCTLAYTNAEDGYSKGAMLTEKNLLAEIYALTTSSKITKDSVVCALLPYYHLFGFAEGILVPTHIGATVVIEDINLLRLSETMQNIHQYKVTHFYTVPSIYYLLGKIPGIEKFVANITNLYTGGTQLSEFVHENFFRKTNKSIREGYGLTESSPAIAIDDIEDEPVKNSIGKALPGCEIKIIKENGNECLAGEKGEICVRGDMVFKGYFNNEATTNLVLKNDWLYTGDYGKKDTKGLIYFCGLKKEMINVAGNNLYPKKLERMMKIHKNVADVKVFSQDSVLHGQIAGATIKLHDSSKKAQENFKKWCQKNINNNSLPKIWLFE